MAEQKHTAGPWQNVGHIIATEPDTHYNCERICIVEDGPSPEQSRANAALIKAAPDQNRELHKALVILGQLISWVDESDEASDYASSSALGDIVNQARRWEPEARAAIAKATASPIAEAEVAEADGATEG